MEIYWNSQYSFYGCHIGRNGKLDSYCFDIARPLESFWQQQSSQITLEIVTNWRFTFHSKLVSTLLVRPLPVRSHEFHPFRPPASLPWGAKRRHCLTFAFLHIYEWRPSLHFSKLFPWILRRWHKRLPLVFLIRFRHSSHETRASPASSRNMLLLGVLPMMGYTRGLHPKGVSLCRRVVGSSSPQEEEAM